MCLHAIPEYPGGLAVQWLLHKSSRLSRSVAICAEVLSPLLQIPPCFPGLAVNGTDEKLIKMVSVLCASLEARRGYASYTPGATQRGDTRFAFLITRAVAFHIPLSYLFLCLFIPEGQLELLLRHYVNTAAVPHAVKRP